MLILNNKQNNLLIELGNRYYKLNAILKGRPATSEDLYHNLPSTKKYYPKTTLDISSIVNNDNLSLALSDFKSILNEIGKLK